MIQSLVKTRDKLRKNKKGFTLIELLVVIAILAILAAILIPVVGGFISNAQKGAANADAHTVYSATAAAIASNNTGTAYTDGSSFFTASTGAPTTVLTPYLGTAALNFKITEIDLDSSGNVVYVAVKENANGGQTGTYGTKPATP